MIVAVVKFCDSAYLRQLQTPEQLRFLAQLISRVAKSGQQVPLDLRVVGHALSIRGGPEEEL